MCAAVWKYLVLAAALAVCVQAQYQQQQQQHYRQPQQHYRWPQQQQQQQQQQQYYRHQPPVSRRRGEVSRRRTSPIPSLETLGWATAGLAALASGATLLASAASDVDWEQSLRENIPGRYESWIAGGAPSVALSPEEEPLSPREEDEEEVSEERQLQQMGGSGANWEAIQDIIGRAFGLDHCWELAICDSHARYDDYGLLALPITIYYSGSSDKEGNPDSIYQAAAIAGKAREDCPSKYRCLVNPMTIAKFFMTLLVD